MENTVPSRKQFAAPFRWSGRVSFWLHLTLGCLSGGMLAIAILSRGFSAQSHNPLIGIGIFLAICAFLSLGFRTYWAFRYTRLAKQLQSDRHEPHPQRSDIIKALKIGLAISCSGLFFAFLASEVTILAILAKTLAHPQSMAVYDSENAVRSLDILLVLADINILGAHLLGSFNSLEFLHWVQK